MTEDTNDGFPFNEYGQGKLRRDIGETDYYRSWQEAKDAGWDDNQIWSVTGEDNTHLYGPPHHYVNHIGHIATEERHDGKTYYEESWENDDEGDMTKTNEHKPTNRNWIVNDRTDLAKELIAEFEILRWKLEEEKLTETCDRCKALRSNWTGVLTHVISIIDNKMRDEEACSKPDPWLERRGDA